MNALAMKQQRSPFRLALRVEGDKWVAYLAQHHSMTGAVWLGSILLSLITDNPGRKAEFMALMQAAFADVIERVLGGRASWPNPPERAAEHERSGTA